MLSWCGPCLVVTSHHCWHPEPSTQFTDPICTAALQNNRLIRKNNRLTETTETDLKINFFNLFKWYSCGQTLFYIALHLPSVIKVMSATRKGILSISCLVWGNFLLCKSTSNPSLSQISQQIHVNTQIIRCTHQTLSRKFIFSYLKMMFRNFYLHMILKIILTHVFLQKVHL